jgi:uncharacterized protein (DUF983 family)
MKRTDDPKYLSSLLKLKCPHCRRGDMFTHKHSFTKKFMQMNENCTVCGQPMEIEPSFYYGTGYVSYSLAIAISVSTFLAWWVLIGFSFHDNRFFWWIGLNAFLLTIMQPYLMRLSRTIWLSFFVKYDKSLSECSTNNELEQKTIRA